MASPLSVSQLLPPECLFDVVLFDEASQVLPEDAVPAVMRGRCTVVAGDRHQLPPMTFFAAGEEEDEDAESAGASEGFESILDLTSAFLTPWSLDWHYRSRDESLIAFSNRHIYGDRLVTFPGTGGEPVLSHVLVQQSTGAEGQEESVSAEVSKVVELVLQHAIERPGETLGVIAMGIIHARRVQAALDQALRERPELDSFFDQTKLERFFIKNLERVQGDERDAIILTVGYGKDRSGRLPYRFGPLLIQGGERRLNVAVTRARRRLTLVSSFSHIDMDPGRSKARGVELLRLYLEYAASGGRRLGDGGGSSIPLNAFEQDVHDTLVATGVSLLPQWGASRYRIDLVAQHPKTPGRFVLAIECDGASYHASPTARDRDRLRQQHLEALGWRFHRIWSTDWFMRRTEEIQRALAAFREAVAYADTIGMRGDRAESAPPPMPPMTPNNAKRGPRPYVPRREKIDDYSQAEILAIIRWVQSDGRLRTDDELVRAVMDEMGFERRGSRIDAVIRAAIAAARLMRTAQS
jgi:very-short-patch-repair endonuclease